MGLFDFMRSKTKESVSEKEIAIEESFIESAEKAALIVSQSVEKGDISDLGDKLRNYTDANSGKSKYVFDRHPISLWIALMLVGILFSVGFLFFIPITAGTYYYSASYKDIGLYSLLVIVIVIIINVFLCRKAIREIRFSKRYDHYQNSLKYRNIEIIDDLASMIDARRELVAKDLKKAVKIKLIPQGHFGKDDLFFMVSDEIYAKYSTSKAAYDRYFRKLLEDRNRMKERTRETEELLSQGEEYIAKIRDCNDIIKDKEVSDKLDRMEKVVSAIFHEVDINPSQANKLGVFINYYLPTTEKLLESYIDIDEKQVKGKALQKTQRDITQALDSINNAFESLLERFYMEQELDVSSDISAMEIIMKQEGLQS